ncbi:hypothetical protein BTW32_26175 [Bacillus thuringiensis]|nr:hypothetical protein BTW32_26175 [Bacillus thuringiensis]
MHGSANQDNINMVEDIADKNRCVLVIGLDGLRSDALKKSWENRKTPAIDRLIQKGSYNFNTQANSNHTWSATGWATVHTGVWMNKHGVTSNSWSGSNFTKYPTLMKRAEEYNPSLRTLSIVQWAPINDKLVEGIDMERNMTTDEGVTTEIIKELDGSNSNDRSMVCFLTIF